MTITEKKKKAAYTLLAGLIGTAVIFIVYAIRGIWPFGSGNITCDDMAQAVLPSYYHFYDWFHGLAPLNWDWFSGLGVTKIVSCIPSPVDLIIFLSDRHKIIYLLGVSVALRIGIAAVTAKISLDRIFPENPQLWHTALALSYALCGYNLTYYTNMAWLDAVILFPLVVLGAKKLFDDGKAVLYTVSLALCLSVTFYLGAMTALTAFFVGGLYIMLLVDKNEKPRRTFQLGTATLSAALLSCWRLLPSALVTLKSSRLENSIEGSASGQNLLEKVLNKAYVVNFEEKFSLMLGLHLALALAALLIFRLVSEKRKREAVFAVGAIVIMFSQIILESTNLIWHGGSYVYFPMRFFFASSFLLVLLGAWYIKTGGLPDKKEKSRRDVIISNALLALFTVLFLAASVLAPIYYKNTVDGNITEKLSVFLVTAASLMTGVIMFVYVYRPEGQAVRVFCLIMVIVSGISTGCATMANRFTKEKQETFYNSESYVEYCNEAEGLDLESGPLERTKNPDTSLNTNYPVLLRTYSLSGWTHIIPKSLQKGIFNLGYSNQYTRVLDSGGTAFTDALMNVRRAVARNTFTVSGGYEKVRYTENFTLYENKYPLDLGLLSDEGILDDYTVSYGYERFDIQNKLYTLFSGDDDRLIDYAELGRNDTDRLFCSDSSESKCTFNYLAEGDEMLYLNASDFALGKEYLNVYVNDVPISAPYYKHTVFNLYPSKSVNGILPLGEFSVGDEVKVDIYAKGKTSLYSGVIQIGYLHLDKLEKLGEINSGAVSDLSISGAKMTFTADNPSSGEKYLFLPISYFDGWKCTVNGEKTPVEKAMGMFLAVRVPQGESRVKLEYINEGQHLGYILSLAGIVLFIVWEILKKKNKTLPKWIYKWVYVMFTALYAGMFGFTYLIQTVLFIKHYILLLFNGGG